MEPVVRLLCDLIAIPSVNPSFPDGTGERDLCAFLEGYAQKVGLDVHRQPISEGRDNILIRLDGKGPETILLEAHMDTVTGEGMTIPPFEPQIRDNKVFGRGACDTKASLAAMLSAIVAVAKKGKPPRTVTLAAVIDEEVNFRGVRELVAQGVKADFCVVGEPTSLSLVIAHKGAVRGFIRTKGISAHSAHPEKGINAITLMTQVIQALNRYDTDLRRHTHPLVGSATLTVTMVRGGKGLNLVPDRCEIGIDRRTLPKEDPITAWEEMKGFLSDCPDLNGIDLEVDEPVLVHWGMEVPKDSLPVQRLQGACRSFRWTPKVCGVHYTTDASELVRAGIPTVVFGPGDIAQAHTAEEWVSIDQLLLAQSIFEALITMPAS